MSVAITSELEQLLVSSVPVHQTAFNAAYPSTPSVKTPVYEEITNRRQSISIAERVNGKTGIIRQVELPKYFMLKHPEGNLRSGRIVSPTIKSLIEQPDYFEIVSRTISQIMRLEKTISIRRIEFRNFKENFSEVYASIKESVEEADNIDQIYDTLLIEIFNDKKLKSIVENLPEPEKLKRLKAMVSLRVLQHTYSSLSAEEQSEFKKEALRGTHFGKISP